MTIIEKFLAFAEQLPNDKRHLLDDMLASVMETMADDGGFTQQEMSELDRRMADPNPEYADPEEIEAIFRRFDKA